MCERHCQRLADVLGDGGVDELERRRRRTSLRHWIDRDSGMYELRGSFDPETGTRLFAALDAELERTWHGPGRARGRRARS